MPAITPRSLDKDGTSAKDLAAIRKRPTFRQLMVYFAEGGVIRRPDSGRLAEGSDGYKKGWEVRILVASRSDLQAVRSLLEGVGLTPGKPYKKYGTRIVQPVYGRAAVELFSR